MRISLVFLFITLCQFCLAQDSTVDSSVTLSENWTAAAKDSSVSIVVVTADTTKLQSRAFNDGRIKSLQEDPDFHYKEPPTVAESLWDRFLKWLAQFFSEAFNKAVYTTWGNVILYLVGLALIVVVVLMFLKVNAFKLLYGTKSLQVKEGVVDENIHEMNFEQLIQEAIHQEDYRKGIRLLFLYALKLLSDKHLIHWESGKTNREYVSEVSHHELKPGLSDLSFYFDYAWYGNFPITAETFTKAQAIFATWKQKVM